MITTMQTTKMLLPAHAEAEIYLSADGYVLTVLADGTAVKLPRERYDHLVCPARKTKTWASRVVPSLYWFLRFAALAATWHSHR